MCPRNGADSPRNRGGKSGVAPGYSEGWRLSRPCSGVTTQRRTTTRPSAWEDEASTEPLFRRMQEVVSPAGHGDVGMPMDMSGLEGDGSLRYGGSLNPWWRPASTVGKVFLFLATVI